MKAARGYCGARSRGPANPAGSTAITQPHPAPPRPHHPVPPRSRTLIAPIERLRTLMMLSSTRIGLRETFWSMWKDGGFRGLFKGHMSTVIKVGRLPQSTRATPYLHPPLRPRWRPSPVSAHHPPRADTGSPHDRTRRPPPPTRPHPGALRPPRPQVFPTSAIQFTVVDAGERGHTSIGDGLHTEALSQGWPSRGGPQVP